MKRLLIFMSLVVTMAVLSRCNLTKTKAAAVPEPNYEFPTTMNEQVKAQYLQEFKKGEILYSINCAKCHSSIVKKKEQIPDFTLEQLMSYEIRASNPKHEDRMSEVQVSTEELGYIITFLSYKKKNIAGK